MKAFFVLASLLVVVSASLGESREVLFMAFKEKHNKTYKNQVEETTRFTIFRENIRSIEEHNARYDMGLETYKKGINKFSDMTHEEFKAFLGLHVKPNIVGTTGVEYVLKGSQVPELVDWRKEGYVTPVKDQGSCGSCWAFSITGSTEGAYYRKHKQLISLSEQQLVDCSTINEGCDGGYLEQNFPYVKKHGLERESDYPYIDDNDECHYSASKVATKIDSYVSMRKNEKELLEAVATVGPVSIAMDATYLSFYDSGIYSGSKCTPAGLNHGVLIVGYGIENGTDYWIVKNSWGEKWGEQGYFRIERGTNHCGVAEDTSYPIIN